MSRVKTDAEKLKSIQRYANDLNAMATNSPAPEDATPEEAAHWEAVNMAYSMVATNILNIIEHGSTRPPRKAPNAD